MSVLILPAPLTDNGLSLNAVIFMWLSRAEVSTALCLPIDVGCFERPEIEACAPIGGFLVWRLDLPLMMLGRVAFVFSVDTAS